MNHSIFLVRYGKSAKAFELREAPSEPVKPLQVDELWIETEASGINFADVLARRGLYPEAPKPPSVIGYEVVGRIVATGSPETRSRIGQRVLAFSRFGGYASHVRTSVHAAVDLPPSLCGPDAPDAAALTALGTQYSTAWFAAEERARIHSDELVLIHHAAGGVGLALIELARLRGCKIAGTTSSPAKLEVLQKLGVHYPILLGAKHSWAQALLVETQGRAPDVIFDAVGGATLRQGLALMAPGGRLVSFGVSSFMGSGGPLSALSGLVASGLIHPLSLLTQSKGLIGVNMLKIADLQPAALNRCITAVVGLADRKEIRLAKATSFPAAEVGKAHEYLESRKSVGKVALSW